MSLPVPPAKRVLTAEELSHPTDTMGSDVNLDEGYKFLRVLGLSERSELEAKTLGMLELPLERVQSLIADRHGELDHQDKWDIWRWQLALVGNAHPSVVVPMERGEVGNQSRSCSTEATVGDSSPN